MTKYLVLCLILALAVGREYPLYNQCDAKWANERLGASSTTICKGGDQISAVAMGLTGIGINKNPSSLNTWLKNNKGFNSKNEFVWASVNSLGMTYQGQFANALLRINLDVGYVVIINVNKGAHWVLATGYEGTTIYVKDSLHTTVTSYDMTEIVSGHNAVYKVPNSLPESLFKGYEQILKIKNRNNPSKLTIYE